MKSHPNFRKYCRATNRASRARNNIDAIADLEEDLADQVTRISPTLTNKMYLFKDALIQMLKGISCLNKNSIREILNIRG
jgi:hypothetical protein